MAASDFPWHVGVYDAHCHIGDASDIEKTTLALTSMNAQGLLSFASRAQNQQPQQVLAERACQDPGDTAHVIPGFGWHPWFSHELYDDSAQGDNHAATDDDDSDSAAPAALVDEAKILHYQRVLTPRPDSTEFLLALPDPQPISAFLAQTRRRLVKQPLALVAEIGLDKSFRIPVSWLPDQTIPRDTIPGGRGGRQLSPFRVHMHHQVLVLRAQLRLAAELGRAVSIHGVQAHGILFDTLSSSWKGHEVYKPSKRKLILQKKQTQSSPPVIENESGPPFLPYPPRICLHSFSGSPSLLKQYLDPKIPADIFFSFSTCNNFPEYSNKADASVREVPDHRLLLETDLSHAGPDLDHQLVITARKLCELKGWDIEHGLRQLRQNYMRFVYGDEKT